MDYVHLNLLLRQLDQRARHCLNRAVHVTLNDDIQLLERTDSDTTTDLIQRHVLLGHNTLHTLQLLALVSDLACRAIVLHNVEGITRCRSAIQTQHLYGSCGRCLIDLLTTLVEHSLHTARVNTRQHHVTNTQSTVLHQQRSYVTATLIQRRLDYRTRCTAVGISLQLQQLGLQKHLFEQLVEVQTLLSRNLLALILTTPILNEVVHISQLLLDMVGICCGLIDLIDCKHDRYTCCRGVVDSLDRLRHHVVVSRNDDNRNVSNLRTTRTHRRKCLVTGGIEEGDLLTIQLNAICTDVLRDTAGLTLDDVGLTDIIQQRGLTVVNVTHHNHDRRTRDQLLLGVALVLDSLLDLHRYELNRETELLGNHYECLSVQTLVDRHHKTEVHTSHNDLIDRNVHHRSQLADGYELRNLQYRALHLLTLHLLVHLGRNSLALLLTVLRALALRVLSRQTCQSILYLLCYLLVANLGANNGFGCRFLLVLLLFATTLLCCCLLLLLLTILLLGLVGLAAICGLLLTTLLRLGHINLILGNALTLGMTTTRLELRHVDRANHIRARQLRRLRTEDIITALSQTLIVGLGLNIVLSGFGLHLRYGCRDRSCRRLLNLGLHGFLLRLGCRFGLGLGSGRRCWCRLSRLLASQIDRTQNLRAHRLNLVLNRDTLTLDYDLLLEIVITLFLTDRHCRRFLRDTLTHLTARIATAVRSELLFEKCIHLSIDQRIRRAVDLDALLFKEVGYAAYSNFELSRNLIESKFTFV